MWIWVLVRGAYRYGHGHRYMLEGKGGEWGHVKARRGYVSCTDAMVLFTWLCSHTFGDFLGVRKSKSENEH